MAEDKAPRRRTFGLRPAPEEPEEQPSNLGRMLLRVRAEMPGQWVDVMEDEHESHVKDQAARVRGSSKNRVAGIVDRAGWEARAIDRKLLAEEAGRTYDDATEGPRWVLRVRWSEEKAAVDRELAELIAHRAEEAAARERSKERHPNRSKADDRADAAFDGLREDG